MAFKGIEMSLVLVFVVMLWGGATAQSGCSSAIMGLSPCLNFITGNSSTPSSSCCSQLSSVVQSQPSCLCSVLNGGGASIGVAINQTLALALPGACNVQTPSLSQCNAANGPVPSAATPASSPMDSPSDSSNVPSGAGSKTVPSTNGSSSARSNMEDHMAPKGIDVGLVLALVAMLWWGATAQSGCTSALMGMSPCLKFVSGNSSTPSSSCCSQLASVVQSQPQCLCSLLNGGGASLGITINQTLALALPGACKVQTPPLSQCNGKL
ncbi:hypothetical protein RJ640_019731 [Escallonia rubra]|uniref:Bifunctional inhibitor/plant lipid transfer protein/seed storage helical domain-containing protein n=1 Tax=Escallonia rubra TaxID=112253 RepID=A0AA88R1U2_9ASTE|nr:hypothetical protein RJ640_019731 [Escallonia rubra]